MMNHERRRAEQLDLDLDDQVRTAQQNMRRSTIARMRKLEDEHQMLATTCAQLDASLAKNGFLRMTK